MYRYIKVIRLLVEEGEHFLGAADEYRIIAKYEVIVGTYESRVDGFESTMESIEKRVGGPARVLDAAIGLFRGVLDGMGRRWTRRWSRPDVRWTLGCWRGMRCARCWSLWEEVLG